MKNNNYILISMLFISMNFFAFAQDANLEKTRIDINTKIDFANTLIEHFNRNINSLNDYQDEMNTWYNNPSRKIKDMPKYSFSRFTGRKYNVEYEFTFSFDVFNYNYNLNKIERQISLFNVNCVKVENLEIQDVDSLRMAVHKLFKAIQIQALEISEMSYDFRRSCAVNFNTDKHPEQLLMLRDLIVQSKGVILALRNHSYSQANDYYDLLNEFIVKYKNKNDINLLSSDANTLIEIAKLRAASEHIYKRSVLISSWGEQFIQSSYTLKEMNTLLRNATTEFNKVDNEIGCATAFNSILNKKEAKYLNILEEPNTILADIVPEESNYVIAFRKETFDKTNENSLEGSLPNNLIILLDVSASMKKSGKLPIVKNSIKHILNIMRKKDKISLIAYSGEAKVLISGARKTNESEILEILSKLESSGGSDLKNALDSAYLIGNDNFIFKGNNKIIIATDGVFGVTSSIMSLVENQTKNGFKLSIFQYNKGKEKNNSKPLKSLTDIGGGDFRTIKSEKEAISVLMKEIKKEFGKE